MGLRDLFTLNAELIRDPTRFGEEIMLFDPVTDPATQTAFNGILEVLGNDPLLRTSEEEAIYEQATIEVPISIAINPKGWFIARGTRWNITGFGGRDLDNQTINVQSVIPIAKKTASRRG